MKIDRKTRKKKKGVGGAEGNTGRCAARTHEAASARRAAGSEQQQAWLPRYFFFTREDRRSPPPCSGFAAAFLGLRALRRRTEDALDALAADLVARLQGAWLRAGKRGIWQFE